ncbi:ABC transporter ATP-binding protein [Cognatishimia activa]|uniref:ABC transporter ATP-binding protein n=1 Tax=Cognatishimia activa TaxID=1715691 RepID=UPI00223145AE|nr:ABC transporter ATP-binding protein [Cognatishimia activa]UZD90688.1 ABC transporter ATP-binding protein/permease [Cognatishimia activa]
MNEKTIFERLGITRLVVRFDPFRPVNSPPPQRLTGFVRWALKGCGGLLLLGIVFSAMGGTVDAIAAYLLGAIIDTVLASDPATVFSENAWLFVGFIAFFLILRPLLFTANLGTQILLLQPNIGPMVNARLHRWVMGQSVSFFDNDFAGRIAQKQLQTSSAISEATVEVVNTVVFAVISVVAATALMAMVDWRIAIPLVLWIAAYVMLLRFFIPRVRKKAKLRANARSVVSGQLVDTITNMRTVKLFANSQFEDRAAINAMGDFRETVFEFGYVSVSFRACLMVLAGTLPVLIILSSVYFWSAGSATPGEITAAGAQAIRLGQMTNWVSFSLMSIYAKIGEIEDGMHTLTAIMRIEDRDDAKELQGPATVEFQNVDFAYSESAAGISDVSIKVTEGEKIGLVGASGAGKSTFVSLLLRLYEADSGEVRVAGHDVQTVTQESLRRHVGMVTQETAMFNRSAMENIRYGRPDASENEVIAAAKKARAHEFILDMKDQKGRAGYDAFLGERGVKLSGGQRQRIALARAILKDAPILILDEATSALDSEVEAEIQEALHEVVVGKTVIAIAHRLSTIAEMDRIIVMDRGRIVEEGSHADLLTQDGLYAGFWRRQSGGFIAAEAAE